MRAKFYTTLGVLLITLSFSCYAALPAITSTLPQPNAYTQKVLKQGDIGHDKSKGIGAIGSTNAGATDPQEKDKQAGTTDPDRMKAFMDRYNNMKTNSGGMCGQGTREGMELLTGYKYDGANGGDLWKQLLKTGLWREAYDGEDYTGKIVVRSLQNDGYGHAESMVSNPYNPSEFFVSSDFRQKGSLIKSSRYYSHKDVVYLGNQNITSNFHSIKSFIHGLKLYACRKVVPTLNQG